MHARVKPHVGWVAAVASLVSLGLVFGAATRSLPTGILPRAGDGVIHAIPHVNALISVLAIGVIARGWYQIRRDRDVRAHRRSMLAGAGLFAAFLALYLYKVALEGPAGFPGPAGVETWVYLPLLVVHMVLATVCVPLLWYVLLLAWTHEERELPGTAHPRVGRVAVPLWLTSFALGLAVYAMLYHLF